jgi:hypothetical protein
MSVFGLAIVVGLSAYAVMHMPTGAATIDRADQFMAALRDHDNEQLAQSTTPRFRERIALQSALGSSSLGRRLLGQSTQPQTIVSFREVGSVPLEQGGSVYFFIATSRDANGNEVEVPYTVTVALNGLVDNVD